MAVPRRAAVPQVGRATSNLAHCIMAQLRVEVRKEQIERQCHRVHLPLCAMAAWGTWNSLMSLPQLRLEVGFPGTCHLMRSLQEQTAQLLGITCMGEALSPHLSLTIQDRAYATEDRVVVLAELEQLPTWIERRMELLTVENRHVLERYMTATAEVHFELSSMIADQALQAIADRCAETCTRCRFRQSTDTTAAALPRPMPSSSTTATHGATAYGFGPPRDPNLELTATMTTAGTGPSMATPTSAPTPAEPVGTYESSEEWSIES